MVHPHGRGERDVMGDLAQIFHFPPSDLDAITVDELLRWHKQALRFNAG